LSENLSGENIGQFGTGRGFEQEFVSIVYRFEIYEVTVKLTVDGKFVGIEGVRVNKDFRTYKTKTPQTIFSESEELPPENSTE
jgi:hypothetical protein